MSDAVGTVVGACLEQVLQYVESASGVAEGGRTGRHRLLLQQCLERNVFRSIVHIGSISCNCTCIGYCRFVYDEPYNQNKFQRLYRSIPLS